MCNILPSRFFRIALDGSISAAALRLVAHVLLVFAFAEGVSPDAMAHSVEQSDRPMIDQMFSTVTSTGFQSEIQNLYPRNL